MRLVLYLSILVNIMTFISFMIGFAFTFKEDFNPKHIAKLGVVIGIITIIYLIFLSLVVISGCITGNYSVLSLLLFIISPFIIGHYVKYETIRQYSIIQLFSFALSLFVLFILL